MSDTPETPPTKTINIALPNGIILTLIGFFLFITPFATELEPTERMLDWVAGGILIAGGIIMAAFGYRAQRASRGD